MTWAHLWLQVIMLMLMFIIHSFEDGNKGQKKHRFFFFFDCCLSGIVRRTNVKVTEGLAAFATSKEGRRR